MPTVPAGAIGETGNVVNDPPKVHTGRGIVAGVETTPGPIMGFMGKGGKTGKRVIVLDAVTIVDDGGTGLPQKEPQRVKTVTGTGTGKGKVGGAQDPAVVAGRTGAPTGDHTDSEVERIVL